MRSCHPQVTRSQAGTHFQRWVPTPKKCPQSPSPPRSGHQLHPLATSQPPPLVPTSPQTTHHRSLSPIEHFTGLKTGGPSMVCEVRKERDYSVTFDTYLRHTNNMQAYLWVLDWYDWGPTSLTPSHFSPPPPPPGGPTTFPLTGRLLGCCWVCPGPYTDGWKARMMRKSGGPSAAPRPPHTTKPLPQGETPQPSVGTSWVSQNSHVCL